MKIVVRSAIAALLLALTCIATDAARGEDFKPPVQRPNAKVLNVVIFIGDGMGPQQVRAGSLFTTGEPAALSFHKLPRHATVVTDSASPGVPTDSAASATALATGVKVTNSVVAMRIPGDQSDLPTIAELMKAKGAAIGFVTTDSVVGATPAAFFSHAPSRGAWKKIANDYSSRTQPDLFLGSGHGRIKPQQFADAGYSVVDSVKSFTKAVAKATADGASPQPLGGLFPEDRFVYRYHDETDGAKQYGTVYPTLPQMTTSALEVLSRRGGERGFFLLVESALVDKSGHAERVREGDDRINCNVRETQALSEAVAVAVEWAKRPGAPPTLIIVTADHETGGLSLGDHAGKGKAPFATWLHKDHTRTPVDVWTNGFDDGAITGQIDNTDIFRLMARAAGVEDAVVPPISAADRLKQPTPDPDPAAEPLGVD